MFKGKVISMFKASVWEGLGTWGCLFGMVFFTLGFSEEIYFGDY